MQQLTARYIFAVSRSTAPVNFILNRQRGTLNDQVHSVFDKNVEKLIILPWASDIRWTKSPAVNITFTSAKSVVERAGVRMRDVTLSGDVGPMPQRWPGMPTEDPVESIQAIEDAALWLEKVVNDASLTLQLFAINEGVNWIAIPQDGVNLSRSRGNRTGLHYDMNLRLLMPAAAPKIDMWLWSMPSLSKWPKNPLKAALQAVKMARAYVNKAINAVKGAMAWVDNNILGPINDTFNELMGIADDLLNLADDLEKWGAGIIHKPQEWWNKMKRTADKAVVVGMAFKRDFYDYFKKGGNFSPYEIQVGKRVQSTSDVTKVLEAVDASVDSTLIAMQTVLTSLQASQGSSGLVAVHPGDSIESMALRYYGDPDGVTELISLNNLRYPYISDRTMPGTLGPGSRIIVPQLSSSASNTINPPGITDPDIAVLGSDLAMSSTGDFVLKAGSNVTGSQMDLDIVSGEQCYIQNQDCRIKTIKGNNLLFPTVGLPVSVGWGATRERMAAFATDALQEIKSDDRVAATRDFKVTSVGNKVGFEVQVDLRTGQDVSAAG